MHKILTNTWVIILGGVVLALLAILLGGPGPGPGLIRRALGCVTCKVPAQERRDQKKLAGVSVIRLGNGKIPLVRITGLAPAPISMTPTVARALIELLQRVT